MVDRSDGVPFFIAAEQVMKDQSYIGRIVGFVLFVILSIVSVVVLDYNIGRYTHYQELWLLAGVIITGYIAAFLSLGFAEASIRRGADYRVPGFLSLTLSVVLIVVALVLYKTYMPSVERFDDLFEKDASDIYIHPVISALIEEEALEKGIISSKREYFSYERTTLYLFEVAGAGWAKDFDPELVKRMELFSKKQIEYCTGGKRYCVAKDIFAVVAPFAGDSPELTEAYLAYSQGAWKECSDKSCRAKTISNIETALGKKEASAFTTARHEELLERLGKVGVTEAEPLDERIRALDTADAEFLLYKDHYEKIPEALAMRAAYAVHRAALLDTRPALGHPKAHFDLILRDLIEGCSEHTIDTSRTYLFGGKFGVKVITREHEGKITGAMLTFDYKWRAELGVHIETERWIERLTGTSVDYSWNSADVTGFVVNQIPIDIAFDEKNRPARVIIGDYPIAERAESIVWLASSAKEAEHIELLIRHSLDTEGVKKGSADYKRYYAESRKIVEEDIAKRGFYSPLHTPRMLILNTPIPRSSPVIDDGFLPSSGYSNRAGSRGSSSSSSRSSYSSGGYGSGK